MFCNFDEFLFPNPSCESCGRHETPHGCEKVGLPEKGAAECLKVCFNGNDRKFECDNSATCGSSGSTGMIY